MSACCFYCFDDKIKNYWNFLTDQFYFNWSMPKNNLVDLVCFLFLFMLMFLTCLLFTLIYCFLMFQPDIFCFLLVYCFDWSFLLFFRWHLFNVNVHKTIDFSYVSFFRHKLPGDGGHLREPIFIWHSQKGPLRTFFGHKLLGARGSTYEKNS